MLDMTFRKVKVFVATAMLTAGALGPLHAADIKIGFLDSNLPFDSPQAAMATVFKNVVERKTGGRITVSLFGSSRLGNDREVIEAMRLGLVQSAILAEGGTVNFFPPMNALAIPYLYSDIETAFAVMDGPYGEKLKEEMRKAIGIRILATSAPGPFRNFSTRKPVTKIEDLKGLRIRTIENPAYEIMVKSFGASPTPIGFAEVFSALDAGIIDGVELPSQAILNAGITKAIKYVVEDQHTFLQIFLMVSDKWLQGLSPEDREAVLYAAKVAEIASRGQVFVWQAEGLNRLRKEGVTIFTPSRSDLEVWKKRAQEPVIAWIRSKIDPTWVDELLAATAKAAR